MPELVLLEFDIWRSIVNESKIQSLKAQGKPLWFTVACQVDKVVFDEINKDPKLQQRLTDPATTAYNKMLSLLVGKAKELDNICLKKDNVTSAQKKKAIADFKKIIITEMKSLQKTATTGMEKAWQIFVKTKEDYKKYKIKAGCKIGLEVASITVNVVGAVSSAGFSLVVGIYSLVKSVASLVQQVYKLAQAADSVRKKVNADLDKMLKGYNKNKKKAQAEQVGKVLINFLFGFDATKTISNVKGNNQLYLDKLKGVDVNSHDISKNLNKCLLELDKFSKEIKTVKSSKIVKAMTNLQKGIDQKINKIIELSKKVEDGMKWQKDMAFIIDLLHKAQSSKWIDYFEKGLVLVDLGLTGGATDWKDLGSVLGSANSLLKEVDSQLVDKI